MLVIITILIIIAIMIMCLYYLARPATNSFKNISTKNVYKIWIKTLSGTKVSFKALKELQRRNYWGEQEKSNEQKAIEIFNKYNK